MNSISEPIYCIGPSCRVAAMMFLREKAMSLSLLKFVGQASLVDDAMLPS